MNVSPQDTSLWQQRMAERPELFEVVRGFGSGVMTFDMVGNAGLLEQTMKPVHVRHRWGMEERRDYKNSCILEARKGTVLISPFISTDEKQVLQVALKERLQVVILMTKGMPGNYQVPPQLMDACYEGRLLLMAPTEQKSILQELEKKKQSARLEFGDAVSEKMKAYEQTVRELSAQTGEASMAQTQEGSTPRLTRMQCNLLNVMAELLSEVPAYL